MTKVNVKLDDKPNLKRLMQDNPKVAKEVFDTFLSLLEVTAEHKWHELPNKFVPSGGLTFKDLVHGILFGSLNVREMNAASYDVVGEYIHPLALLGQQEVSSIANEKEVAWQDYFKLPPEMQVDKDAVEHIIRNVLRVARWIDMQSFFEALTVEQVAVWKTDEQNQAAILPIQPALNYQKTYLGALYMGTFLEDTALFDCGMIAPEVTVCPSCQISELIEVKDHLKGCLRCQAGFTYVEETEEQSE